MAKCSIFPSIMYSDTPHTPVSPGKWPVPRDEELFIMNELGTFYRCGVHLALPEIHCSFVTGTRFFGAKLRLERQGGVPTTHVPLLR